MRKRYSLIYFIAIITCLLQSSFLLSQQDTAPEGIELDPVTISATLNPMNASKTGRNILVIKGEQFSYLPVKSIDELLRYIPGVEVQLRGPMGAQSDIVIRGGTFQQVLVILDGLRLNDPNTGHFNSYIPIAPAEIERIEILKGASSAIYGSEAVGGVIHIITRTFAAKSGTDKKNLSLHGGIGEYNLFSANAGGYYQSGKTALGGGVLTNNTEGQPQRGTRGFLNNHTASLSISHFLNNNWTFNLRSAYDQRDFSAQNFYTSFTSDTATEEVTTIWNQLQLIHKGKNGRWTFDLGYKNVNDHFRYNAVSLANENRSQLWQTLLKNESKIDMNSTLTMGIQFMNKIISSNDRGNHSLYQGAGFFVLNRQIGEDFFLSPALRLDWNERSGWELVPQVNLSYQLNKVQLRGSAGKTIRDADFTERFNNYNKPLVTSGRVGNPFLEAERSISYEFGADYLVNHQFKISATAFARHHSRLIDWNPTLYSDMPRKENLSPTGSYALAKNISQVKTRGAEIDLQYVHSLNEENKLWGNLGITWLNSESSDSTPSFYISSHARFMANFSLQFTGKRLGLSANGIYKKREPQSASLIHAEIKADYFMMNLKANVFLHKNKSGLFVQVDNIFNHKGQDLLGSVLPGRWLSGGFSLNFQ
ncbi:MAG: TonB-dependent receptor [Chitinophagaceae bacterium]|jgi:iron complex outermembrane receptor protein|nr:TonB-dependent receptor [Chitinophagaceae bacterium]